MTPRSLLAKPLQPLFLAAALMLAVCSPMAASSPTATKSQQPQFVYVSASQSSKCYHINPGCWGLKNSTKVNKTYLHLAKQSKRPCKMCCPPEPKPLRRHKTIRTPKARDYHISAEDE